MAIAVAAGGVGYTMRAVAPPSAGGACTVQEVTAPAAGTTRVIYSLDAKQNDQEIIALINGAHSHIYFAIYEFTLEDVADALVAAKERGVDVEGLVDSVESASSYDAPVIAKLRSVGIPVATEHHADGTGIMHIKALVTDSSYAVGSYNWTESATTENDELLEIGTSPDLVAAYANILQRLIKEYSTGAAPPAGGPTGQTYDYTVAPAHIGEYASVRGTLVDSYTSSNGTVFLDFCKSYKTCPFSGVIFADDAKRFGDLSSLAGKPVTLTGMISSYQGKAEIILSTPSQITQ